MAESLHKEFRLAAEGNPNDRPPEFQHLPYPGPDVDAPLSVDEFWQAYGDARDTVISDIDTIEAGLFNAVQDTMSQSYDLGRDDLADEINKAWEQVLQKNANVDFASSSGLYVLLQQRLETSREFEGTLGRIIEKEPRLLTPELAQALGENHQIIEDTREFIDHLGDEMQKEGYVHEASLAPKPSGPGNNFS